MNEQEVLSAMQDRLELLALDGKLAECHTLLSEIAADRECRYVMKCVQLLRRQQAPGWKEQQR